MRIAIDLDGVVWLAHAPIDGSVAAVRRLAEAGHDVVFVTNNSSQPVPEVEAALAAIGVDAGGRVATSSLAAATLLEAGQRAVVCGAEGIRWALEGAGVTVVESGPADAAVVGWTRSLTYDLLATAHRAIERGARFVATNTDSTYPTGDGSLPGGGATVAALATSTGVAPEVAGKPHAPMARLVQERWGPVDWVVGDRADTDGRFAATLGARFARVATGTAADGAVASDVTVDHEAPDLAAAVDHLLGCA